MSNFKISNFPNHEILFIYIYIYIYMRILPRYISILALKICLAIIYIYRKFEKQISYHLFEDKTYNTSSGNSIHKNKSKFGTI